MALTDFKAGDTPTNLDSCASFSTTTTSASEWFVMYWQA